MEGDSLQLSDFNALIGTVTNEEKAKRRGFRRTMAMDTGWTHLCSEVHNRCVVSTFAFLYFVFFHLLCIGSTVSACFIHIPIQFSFPFFLNNYRWYYSESMASGN